MYGKEKKRKEKNLVHDLLYFTYWEIKYVKPVIYLLSESHVMFESIVFDTLVLKKERKGRFTYSKRYWGPWIKKDVDAAYRGFFFSFSCSGPPVYKYVSALPFNAIFTYFTLFPPPFFFQVRVPSM